ncbi:MAG: pentapeptide repeat-containing protein [Planococcus citreus]
MKKNKKTEPMLPKELETISFIEALDDGYVHDCRIVSEELPAGKIHFDRVLFENVRFLGGEWERSEFADVVFINCDLSNADLGRAVFHRVKFENCRLLGTDFTESTIRYTRFKGCRLDYAVFGFSHISDVIFEQSALRQGDFYEVDLKNTQFLDSELNEANFTGTSLKGIDFSSSRFEELQLTMELVSGCKVSTDQALLFARKLGLIITE